MYLECVIYFFLMWTLFFKVFIEFVTVLLLLLLCFGFLALGMWDLSFLTRD